MKNLKVGQIVYTTHNGTKAQFEIISQSETIMEMRLIKRRCPILGDWEYSQTETIMEISKNTVSY